MSETSLHLNPKFSAFSQSVTYSPTLSLHSLGSVSGSLSACQAFEGHSGLLFDEHFDLSADRSVKVRRRASLSVLSALVLRSDPANDRSLHVGGVHGHPEGVHREPRADISDAPLQPPLRHAESAQRPSVELPHLLSSQQPHSLRNAPFRKSRAEFPLQLHPPGVHQRPSVPHRVALPADGGVPVQRVGQAVPAVLVLPGAGLHCAAGLPGGRALPLRRAQEVGRTGDRTLLRGGHEALHPGEAAHRREPRTGHRGAQPTSRSLCGARQSGDAGRSRRVSESGRGEEERVRGRRTRSHCQSVHVG